jgi:leader peptidase (prepilin peptidase)/N-methyltransferase
MILETLSLLCLLAGLLLLIYLSIIDLKTFLLPNKYVAPFAIFGVLFHFLTDFHFLNVTEIIIGGMCGFGLLWSIRFMGNKYYGQDSLGLGDVKLLGAAGLWLGLEGVLFAMTLGAFAGLLHGLAYAAYRTITKKQPFSITKMVIPAGPGFAIGIILVGGWMYKSHVLSIFYDWFA